MLLGDLRTFRRLMPAFSLQGVVFCWECSLCHKLFMHVPHDRPPRSKEVARINSEFEQHDCAIHFAASRNRKHIAA
jgi:hypothetical protein